MILKQLPDQIILSFIRIIWGIKKNSSSELGNPSRILIIRQHNQFGDLLASISLFRAVKETFPESELNVVTSPANYIALDSNKYIDRNFIFDKKKIFSLKYYKELMKFLRKRYDLAIVPATVSISFTSCLLARISDAAIRIGPSSLNGEKNKYSFLFDRQVDLDWREYPDEHVSDFILDIVRPFGIITETFTSHITFRGKENSAVKQFLFNQGYRKDKLLIGFHIGAGKPKNRWSLDKYVELMKRLNEKYPAFFFLTGSSADNEELAYFSEKSNIKSIQFLNKQIPELAALISKCHLFITNDTGVMHVAGATKCPQISIFGPTNPFNWAPLGPNKYFVRKSELIDDVTVEDILKLSEFILSMNI